MESGRFLESVQTERELYYSSLLINEIENEHIEEVKQLLLHKNANPNLVLPNRGIAAMHVIAGLENEYFSVEVLEIAIEDRNGDPNVQSDDGLTPVHVAAIWGRCATLEVLLKYGGNPFLQEYKLSLNAEDLALKEHQWQTHAILATFSVFNDNEYSDNFSNDTSFFEFENELSNKVPLYSEAIASEKHFCENEISVVEKNCQIMESEAPSFPSQQHLINESAQINKNPSDSAEDGMKSDVKLQQKKKFSDQFVESFSKLRSFFGRASFPKMSTNNSPKVLSKRKPTKMSL